MLVLQKNTMLVGTTVKLAGFLGERKDTGATELIASKYQADEKAVKGAKFLIDRTYPAVKRGVAMAQRVRQCGYDYSFPWGDSKLRLLPVKARDDFDAKIQQAIADFWSVIDNEYLPAYPHLVKEAEHRLGLLFDPHNYPNVNDVRKLFKCQVEYWPVPSGDNFIADIAQDAANEARQSLQRIAVERANEAVNETLTRIEKGVSLYVAKLANFKPADKAAGEMAKTFRDSATQNIEELADLVKKLNFADDAGINNLANQIQRLARYSCETLREDKMTRDAMIAEANGLIGKLDGMKKSDLESDQIIAAVADYM